GDGRASPALVDHGITAAWAERTTNRTRQFRHAGGQLLAGLLVVGQYLSHNQSPSSLSESEGSAGSFLISMSSQLISPARLDSRAATTVRTAPFEENAEGRRKSHTNFPSLLKSFI